MSAERDDGGVSAERDDGVGGAAARLVGLLAEPNRRAVVAALVLGNASVADVRRATGLDARAVTTALARLCDGELVLDSGDGSYYLIEAAFTEAARSVAATREAPGGADAPSDAQRVLRSFVRDGKLTAIPVPRAKRLVVLDLLAQEFELGRRYPERAVNQLLRRWHDDTAALRRYLVDEGFLDRADGEYWRCGGTAMPPPDGSHVATSPD